jgi:hypothetical protein
MNFFLRMHFYILFFTRYFSSSHRHLYHNNHDIKYLIGGDTPNNSSMDIPSEKTIKYLLGGDNPTIYSKQHDNTYYLYDDDQTIKFIFT